MGTLYKTAATAVGGRNGTVRSEDGLLNLQLSLPKSLGGTGRATNPEKLFAAGYAACFGNAVIHSSRNADVKIKDDDVEVTSSVNLQQSVNGGFGLAVELEITLIGVDQLQAEAIASAAHEICPYSNALRNNIDVKLTVRTG